MNIQAFISELALREIRAVFLWMEIRAFFVGEVAVRKMSALNLFLVLLAGNYCYFLSPLSYIVLMLTKVNYCASIQLNLLQRFIRYSFQLRKLTTTAFFQALVYILAFGLQSLLFYQSIKVNIYVCRCSLCICALLLKPVKDISFTMIVILLIIVLFLKTYNFLLLRISCSC